MSDFYESAYDWDDAGESFEVPDPIEALVVGWEDGVDLLLRTVVAAPVHSVWMRVTDPTSCADWFAPFERSGDDLRFSMDDGALEAHILSCVEDDHILLEVSGLGRVGLSMLAAEDEDAEAGTRLRLTHTFESAAAAAAAVGEIGPVWDTHLRMLIEALGEPAADVMESELDERYARLAAEASDD